MSLSPYLSSFKDKKIAIVLTEMKNPNFYVYLYDFIHKCMSNGAQITIYDTNNFGSTSNYKPKENFFRRNKNKSKQRDYLRIFKESLPKEIKFVEVQQKSIPRKYVFGSSYLESLVNLEKLPQELKRSIQSILVTHINKSATENRFSRKQRENMTIMVDTFFRTSDALDTVLAKMDAEVFVSLNGRKADQAAVTYFCRKNNINHFFFENGSNPGLRYYIAPTEPQNVTQFQNWFKRVILESRSEDERLKSHEKAEKWFQNRVSKPPDFGQGPHLESLPQNYGLQAPSIGLFLSSIGEMDYFEGNLDVQFQIWENLLRGLTQNWSANILVRFHPNMLNYSWSDIITLNIFFRKILKEYGIKHATFIQPWSNISSYRILENLNAVITWNSTIALEAAYMGIPIGVLTKTFYSEILEIQPITMRKTESLNSILTRVSKEKCLDACSVLLDNGEFVSQATLHSRFYVDIFKDRKNKTTKRNVFHPIITRIILKIRILLEVNRTPFNTKRLLSKAMNKKLVLKVLDIILEFKIGRYRNRKIADRYLSYK